MTEFLKRYWKPIAVVVGLVAAFMVGRYTTPGPDVKEVVVTKEVKTIDEKAVEAEVARRVKDIESKMNVKTHTHWEEKPDGTKTKTETKEVVTETKSKETEDKVKEKIVEKVVYVDRDVEKKVEITNYKPQWKVGVAVGAAPFIDPDLTKTPLLVGVTASRRLAGPFWLDATLLGGVQFNGGTRLGQVGATIGLSGEF